MRTLNKKELYQLVSGGCFFASGGGGALASGTQLADTLPDGATVNLATVAEAAKDSAKLTAVVAFIGEPSAAAGEKMTAEPGLNAFDALNAWCLKTQNKPIGYIAAVEIGAINSVAACVVAHKRNVAVLDADCAGGRSVPALELCSPNAFGVSATPTILANASAQTVRIDEATGQQTDQIVRGLISAPAFSDIAGIALWVMPATQVATAIPSQGTISLAIRYGEVITGTAPDKPAKIFEMLRQDFPITNAWRGTVQPVVPDTASGGFDFGQVQVQSDGGELMTIVNQNENVLMWIANASAPPVILPDSINYLGPEGQVMSNVEIGTYAGRKIWVIGMRAQPWMQTNPAEQTAVRYILENGAFYFGPYVPMKEGTLPPD